MQITTTPAPKSTIVVEVEVPAERLTTAVGEATRALSRRTQGPRLPARQGAARRPRGRPRPWRRPRGGRRPARPVRLSRRPDREGDPAAHERRRRDRPGGGGQAADLQGDRPDPPRGPARRLPELQLPARDRDDRRRQGRQGHRGAARPERVARAGRGSRRRRRATTRSSSTRGPATASPFEGGVDRADAADHRRGPPDPGLRGRARRAERSATRRASTSPSRPTTARRRSPARQAHFEVELRELREKVLPELDDDFVRSMGDFADLAELRDEIRKRLERNALDKARHDVLRPDHRVRRRQLDDRPARHPGRPGGRGDARRVPRRAGPAGDQRGGLREGRRQEPRGAPRRLPARRREARPRPARPQPDRRGRGPR